MDKAAPLILPGSRGHGALREAASRLRTPVLLALMLVLGVWTLIELQPLLLHRAARAMVYELGAGAGTVLYPRSGPADHRRGYDRLAERLERVRARGFRVERQVRQSEPLQRALRLGLSPPYRDKSQAGLRILGAGGAALFAARYPERVFERFEAIPPLLVSTLLFVENRDLLSAPHARSNPAIEWDRLGRAALGYPLHLVHPNGRPLGGSTLATQIEKFQHSPGGFTASPLEKLRQVASASLRAYHPSRETVRARREIVLDYVNSVPLSAVPGRGEVHGILDGLHHWFGADPERVRELLASRGGSDAERRARALAYRQSLALVLAAQRPHVFLRVAPDELDRRIAAFLPLLAEAGVVPRDLASDAARIRAELAPGARPSDGTGAKVYAPVRTPLVSLVGARDVYELDRLDLVVETTLDADAQRATAALMERLRAATGPESTAQALAEGDPGGVEYGFTLWERAQGAAHLRVQMSSQPGPFDPVEGARLDLGSTAKLRTLVSYLEAVAALRGALAHRSPGELRALEVDPADRLTRWAAERLAERPDLPLAELIDLALDRRYSASPGERFFTGGGVHTFDNFDGRDDGRVLTVREAFRRSVNLPFVRLMRDLAAYHAARAVEAPSSVLSDRSHPMRQTYLERFAERESRVYVTRFWKEHRGTSLEASLDTALGTSRRAAAPVAAVLRYIDWRAPFETFHARLEKRAGAVPEAEARRLYEAYALGALPLSDRAYVSGVHPLELFVAGYLRERPEAGREEMIAASAEVRRDAYAWLFRTRRKHVADRAIRSEIERDAFARIQAEWQRHGYPFGRLVPSLATAIGSSGDRPAALAELVGLVLADGVREPARRFERLRFAQATPYEAVLAPETAVPERVLHPEVARAVRRLLVETVEDGTGRRAYQAVRAPDGTLLEIGGKTGTGDHRHYRYGPYGRVLGAEVRARTSTFAFFLGDRFFGVATAYVSGPEAADYGFTSALAVEFVRSLATSLDPLIARAYGVEAGDEQPAAVAHDAASVAPATGG